MDTIRRWTAWAWLLGLALLGPPAVAAGAAGTAETETITQVLARSQSVRLASFTPADPAGAAARTLQRSFDTLVHAVDGLGPVRLQVITGEVIAETLQGEVVVANERLAALPEGERLFVLAHELGHVYHHDWDKLGALYRRWIPGAVTPEHTRKVGPAMARDASALAHQHEFDADAFALAVIQHLGYPSDVALSAFMRLGSVTGTATHPSTRQRLALLRAQVVQSY